eukprot:7767078-Pyramimonas_sp.AAC.1
MSAPGSLRAGVRKGKVAAPRRRRRVSIHVFCTHSKTKAVPDIHRCLHAVWTRLETGSWVCLRPTS